MDAYQERLHQEILDEMDKEFEKMDQLKKEVRRAENILISVRLSLADCRKLISHCSVKIFSSISEIINLFGNELNLSDLRDLNHPDCNFFLIETLLVKSVVEKLIGLDWKLQITIRGGPDCITKVVPLREQNSIFEVIPVSNRIINCTVESNLVNFLENEWVVIDLHSISVDISYYFETSKGNFSSLEENLLNVTKMYHKTDNLACVKPLLNLQNELKCHFDKNDLVPTFIKHSYHRLNLESFSELTNDSKRLVDLHFSVNNNKIVILYHKDTEIVKIKCDASVMLLMKKFFLPFVKQDRQKYTIKAKKIVSGDSLESMDLDEILLCYQQLRKLRCE